MLFQINHRTEYRYHEPATEAYMELRLSPPETPWQIVREHAVRVLPHAAISEYTDFFGNRTGFLSMTHRHDHLAIVNELVVETRPREISGELLAITVGEARQVLGSMMTDVYDYLQGTEAAVVGGEAAAWSARFLPAKARLGEAFDALNSAIHREFEYVSGATTNETPLQEIWKNRRGVCQDFAHVMLSVLRTSGIPCRYVCGYIESHPPKNQDGGPMVGALATHAWVEVLLPGGIWAAYDPTNNCRAGLQHVSVAFGRDFRDAAPVRGTFKTAGGQSLKVRVSMRRITS